MKKETFHKPVLVVVGPTAIGKTALSLMLADRYNGEIVSVDSMQVYRYMNIGTAKPTKEERGGITHHLIDIVNPDENYDAARFSTDALQAIHDVHQRNKLPVLTGGTGLYLQALLQGMFVEFPCDSQIRASLKARLEEEGLNVLHEELLLIDRVSAERIHPSDTHRVLRALEIFYATGVPWSAHLVEQQKKDPQIIFKNILQIGLTCERDLLYSRINRRCEEMITAGLELEVQHLLDMGYSRSLKSLCSIGYKHMIKYLSQEWSATEMLCFLARDTRRYAKRQYTWFSKKGDVQWFDVHDHSKIIDCINQWKLGWR